MSSSKRELMLLGFALFLLGVFIVVLNQLGSRLDSIDQQALDWLREHRTQRGNRLFVELTALGEFVPLFLLTLSGTIILYLESHRREALQLALAGLISWLVMNIVKAVEARPRPAIAGRIDFATGFSFPSGHATSGSAICLTLALLAFPLLSTTKMRYGVLAATTCFVALLGFSRAYVGVHYPSDIIAGLSLGTGIACLLHLFLNRRSGWSLRNKKR